MSLHRMTVTLHLSYGRVTILTVAALLGSGDRWLAKKK